MRRTIGWFLATAGLLFIAATTLLPLPQQTVASRLTPLWCLVCGDYGGVDVLNNVLLFVPLSLGLRLTGLPTRTVLLTGALLSLLIELLQWGVIPGRDASLSDLLTNTLGSGLGSLIGTHHNRLLHPGRVQALQLALWGGTIWLATQTATAVLLHPWAPDSELRGVWARSVYGRPLFDGRVVSAVLSGSPLPGDSSLLPSDLTMRIRRGHIDLRLQLRTGRRLAGSWSPIIEVLGPGGAILAVSTLGKDLAFQPPMRASSLRLGRPSLRLSEALSRTPDTEVHLQAGEHGSLLWAEWTTEGRRQRAVRSLTPSAGWSLLTPFRYAYGPEARLITMLWIVGWLLPLGYWAAVPGGRLSRWGSLLLLVAAGLALIPRVAGYPIGHWSEWLAALAGLAGGQAAHRSAAYVRERCDSPSIKESC